VSVPDFDSPEAAALGGCFPARDCRVVAMRIDGDDAYVLLDTGSSGQPYLYGVNCNRRGGRWFEGTSGNGPGWAQSDGEQRLGTWSLWGEAPTGADMVRAELNGEVVEERVVDSFYLLAWWRQPEPDGIGPRVIAFGANGTWVAAPTWP
jgi:hypothetical protein